MSNYAIKTFSGMYSWLSNMHLIQIEAGNKIFPSAEHLYQSLKCVNVTDAELIRREPSPYKAKKLGRIVALRSDWEEIKYQAMLTTVLCKFSSNIRI